jgi:group I intron endonuclease
MVCGIYRIINIKNTKCYIGKSTKIQKRRTGHFGDLKRNDHHNGHLQTAWNKYGEESFIFEVLEECPKEDLTERENFWVLHFRSNEREFGYNIEIPAESPIVSNETRSKMRKNRIGRHLDEKTIKKLSERNTGKGNPFYGKKHTKEVIEKMANSKRGKHLTDEHKQLLSSAISKEKHYLYGKHPSITVREKQSTAHSGEKSSTAKLSWEQVREIREKYATGQYLQKEIADMYNMSRAAIGGIVLNWYWKDTGYTYTKKRCRKLTEEETLEIYMKYHSGEYTQTQLMKEYHKGFPYIHKIVTNKNFEALKGNGK